MLYHSIYPLFELTPEMKEELYPILLFLGMFFVVFGMGGIIIRHIPRKPGSMLDEILSENWEEEDDWDYENRCPKEETARRLAEQAEKAAAERMTGEEPEKADAPEQPEPAEETE